MRDWLIGFLIGFGLGFLAGAFSSSFITILKCYEVFGAKCL
jgi:hypothetical protein